MTFTAGGRELRAEAGRLADVSGRGGTRAGPREAVVRLVEERADAAFVEHHV